MLSIVEARDLSTWQVHERELGTENHFVELVDIIVEDRLPHFSKNITFNSFIESTIVGETLSLAKNQAKSCLVKRLTSMAQSDSNEDLMNKSKVFTSVPALFFHS